MTAKEYLSQIKVLDIKIKHKQEELEELRTKAISTTQVLSQDRVQTSVTGDKMARIVEACLELESEIAKMNIYLLQQREKIINQIHQLQDARYVELLYLRYVCYKRLEDIVCIMVKRNGEPYSYEHILALHGEALQNFSKILKNPM